MATVSPTPASSSQPGALTRKSSLRSGLRRAPSRPQVSRAESNPAPAANASTSYAANDSSDDEIPVPMKLSALTKALLNDDGPEAGQSMAEAPRVRTRAQSHQPSSPVGARERPLKRQSALSASVAAIEGRRHTRATSAQLSSRPTSPVRSQPSRENSPVRIRRVRLSTTPANAINGQAPPAAAQPAAQAKTTARRSTSMSASQRKDRPPSRGSNAEEKGDVSEVKDKDLNTPAQPIRTVKIAIGSSGNRGRSSGVSSKKMESASHASHSENEAPEEPGTAARQASFLGSASRLGSNGSRSRADENQAMQSSMRVKRIGKIPGSFLSGPARRGRRRQSEEDGEGEPLPSSQEQYGQQIPDLIDLDGVENFASSYYAPDRIASGSPVSANRAAKASHKPESKLMSPEPDEIPIPHYRVPPPRPELPSRHDQENEAPTFNRLKSGMTLPEIDIAKVPMISSLRPASPDRKALAAKSANTPHRAAPPPPPKMSILEAATTTAGAATTVQAAKKRNYLKVNGKCYTRLDSLGRGGSAKVYRVAADNGKMFALKRVSIEHADENTVRGFKGEIDLLKKLQGVERVINLFDFEMNEEKQILSLLMEMGELDLNTLLRQRLSPENSKFDPVFVRFYWQEMLECLAAVHAHDIVHSDLKPANFVLVQGRLKLIDFGIANAIQTDETVNVHRETQIGTPNYMSPESLIDSNSIANGGRRISVGPARPKLMKLGKPSDVWSLGCILYQLVYGSPPFGHIANQMARCHAIIDWNYNIEFRNRGLGDTIVPPSLIRTMRRCLNRDQHLRPTCAELLSESDPFLYPVETPEGQLPISEELLSRIIQNVVSRCRDRTPTDSEAIAIWPKAYWESIAKSMRASDGR